MVGQNNNSKNPERTCTRTHAMQYTGDNEGRWVMAKRNGKWHFRDVMYKEEI